MRQIFGLVVATALFEGADLPLGFILREAVLLLQLAHELILPAADHVDVVIGQLAPLLLHLALQLLPIAFDAVPVHVLTPICEAGDDRLLFASNRNPCASVVETCNQELARRIWMRTCNRLMCASENSHA